MSDSDRVWHKLIGDRVRLRELRILHMVIRCGSMAKAAKMLVMTQPAVSQAIGQLEAALGVPMLERTTAGVTPTVFGTAMLRCALDAADALADGIREVEALGDPALGEVVVGTSESYIAGGALIRTLSVLRQLHPGFRVQIVESNTAALAFDDLREHRVDIMLGRASVSVLPEDLHQEVLLEERLLVVTGGQHEWARVPAMRFADLAGKPWVLAPPGSAVYELVATAYKAEGLPMPVPAVTTYSMMLRLQLLASGEYVTAFPDSLVRNEAARWDLAVLPLGLGRTLPVAAYTLRGRAESRAIRAFIAAAAEVARERRRG